MTRRTFFSKLAKAVGVFTILPGAGRVWRPSPFRIIRMGGPEVSFENFGILNPNWVNAPFEIKFIMFDPMEIVRPPTRPFNPADYLGIWRSPLSPSSTEHRPERNEGSPHVHAIGE